MAKNAKKFYVVWAGRETGIFNDWDTCKKQVDQFPGAKYKSFPTLHEAQNAYGAVTQKPAASSTKEPSSQPDKSGKKLNDISIAKIDVQTRIYADGGCKPNPGPSGSGVFVSRNSGIDEMWFGLYEDQGTNNSAELNAFHYALQLAEQELKNGQSVAILSDSKYSISCITQWAAGWEKRGWVRKDGEIKNLPLIQEIFELWKRIKKDVQVHHVAGHAGILGNELADRLSLMAIHQNARNWQSLPRPHNVQAVLDYE